MRCLGAPFHPKAIQVVWKLELPSILFALVDDPNIAEPHILSVLLKFKTFSGWADTDTTISMLDGDVVVNLDSVPPHGSTRRFDGLVTVPFRRFEDDVKGLPLAVGPPRVYIGYAFHAECSDPVWTDLPIVRIVRILAFGRLDLQFVSVL